MPLFGFTCTACGAESELLLRADEKPACTKCGSKRLEKQLSRFSPGASYNASADLGCGTPACCRMDGGGCMN